MIDIFQYKEIKFPKNFYWGTTTAAMQVEGGNHSDKDDKRFAPSYAYGGIPYKMAGKACNSYELFEKDIQLLKKMHLQMYRLSIEWSRIEPQPGEFNEKEIQYYHHLLSRLQEEGIKVCLTILHFSCPIWFVEKDAFKTMDNLSYWKEYLHKIVPVYKDVVDYWIVINEPNMPFEYEIEERINLMQYHAEGYHIIKEYCNQPVSSALSFSIKEPMRGAYDRPDQTMADYVDYIENEFFIHAIRTGEIVMPFHETVYLPKLKDTCDFWALNTYVRQLINARKKEFRFDFYEATHFKALEKPFFTEEIAPEIMLKMLMRFSDRPIMITENGIAVDDDNIRIVYIASMLTAMHQAMQLGANVIGYMHFSLLDNWEWGTTHPTFGLVEVNFETFARKIRNSGNFYGEIAKNNLLNQAIIRKYINEMPTNKQLLEG